MAKKGTENKHRSGLRLSASHILDAERVLIPISPGYDNVLGGGIVSGSLTTLSGKPKSGKTTSLLQMAQIAQNPKYGGKFWNEQAAKKRGDRAGRPLLFYNVENRLTSRDLKGIPGLDLTPMFNDDEEYIGGKFNMAATTESKTLYLEDYQADIEKMAELFPGCIMLVDSIGAMCSKKVGAATDEGLVMDPAPRLRALFMERFGPLIMAKDIIMFCVLHKVANIGAVGNQSRTTVTGGNKLKFGANNILEIKWSETDQNNKGCYILHLDCETSELGEPHITGDAYLRFNKGLWGSYELLLLISEHDVDDEGEPIDWGVSKAGAWWTFGADLIGEDKPKKIQKIANAATFLDENPLIYQTLYERFANRYWTNRQLYLK